jgi:hypothetical protein
MSSNEVLAQNEVYSSIERNEPYSSYIKTILGQVAVTVWDNVLGKPVDVILKGDIKKKDEDCIVKLWDAKEDAFFRRVNRNHFTKGVLIPYKMPANVEPKKTVEQATDEELAKIINSKYMSLVAELNKIESVPVLFRMKNLAEELEKSEKITSVIEKRISELQVAEYIRPEPEQEEE